MKKFYVIIVILLIVSQSFVLSSQAGIFSKKKNSATDNINYDEDFVLKPNSQLFPKQILKTGVVLESQYISPNSYQLATNIGLDKILQSIYELKSKISPDKKSIEDLYIRQDLTQKYQDANSLIMKTNLEIDFTLAEINAEIDLYNEILSKFTSDRDKMVAYNNALSFYSNGVLWAACEGFDIPTYRSPILSIPSGILGIAAGLAPSFFSLYAMHEYNGKNKTSEVEPNMLAKLFGYKTNPTIDYPNSVWTYLNSKPARSNATRSRKDILINRWISDSNISSFTSTKSGRELDIITASISHKKGLNIQTLTARTEMLRQLSSEIYKMKRLLLELSLVVDGQKQFKTTGSIE